MKRTNNRTIKRVAVLSFTCVLLYATSMTYAQQSGNAPDTVVCTAIAGGELQCRSSVPGRTYDYGNGIQTYDPCCTLTDPDLFAQCVSLGVTIGPRPSCKRDVCFDTRNVRHQCFPETSPCAVEGEYCNKILGVFQCCNYVE